MGVIIEYKEQVAFVRENFSEKYIQDHLKEDLPDFLEEYQRLFCSRVVSYADIWQAKQFALKVLYDTAMEKHSEVASYVMKLEGDAWKIVFDGKAIGGLTEIGFLWIYHAVSNPRKKVYYATLHDRYITPKNKSVSSHITEEMIKTMQLSKTYSGVLSDQYLAPLEVVEKKQLQVDQMNKAIDDAYANKETEEGEKKERELEDFLEELKTDYQITHKIFKNGKIKLFSEKIKDGRYKKIGPSIRKNFTDAMDILAKKKEMTTELHDHLSKYIRREGGAFIYDPPEGFKWDFIS